MDRELEMMSDAPTEMGKHVISNTLVLHLCIANDTYEILSSFVPNDIVRYDVA